MYEANARLRDPVYGCAGAICQLQKQVNELQEQLAKAQAEIVNMQCEQANFMTLFCMEMTQASPQQSLDNFTDITQYGSSQSNISFLDDNNFGSIWETLWA